MCSTSVNVKSPNCDPNSPQKTNNNKRNIGEKTHQSTDFTREEKLKNKQMLEDF